MTIKRKNIRPSGLLEVEADNTDTVDTNGFSDVIQTVGAKTAKFSGGATMQANPGLRIGMTQLKINTSDADPGTRIEVGADFIDFPVNGNTVDNNETTFSSATNQSAIGEAVIDYGSIATRDIKLVTRMTAQGAEFGSGNITFFYEISDDNITYTVPVTSPSQFQILNIPVGAVFRDTGIITYDDSNSQSFRYVRLTVASSGGTPTSRTWYIYQVTEQSTAATTVTVRVRSSDTIDTADGAELITDQLMNENETLTFDTDLLLTGNGKFVTLEIVSLSTFDIPVTLSEITSILEV